MYDTICTLPLTADLFAQAISPTEPLLAIGLSTGHVQAFKLPPDPSTPNSASPGEDDDESTLQEIARQVSAAESGRGLVATAWRTRRHKGSCRTVGFGSDGSALYSAGSDGIVKAAEAETGRVTSKIGVPRGAAAADVDAPCLLRALTPSTFFLAVDSGALYLYDVRANGALDARPALTMHPHDDYVSSIAPLPPTAASTSGLPKQIVTTGGTTLAVVDIRRGVLAKSEDQEEELLSSCVVQGLSKRGTNVGSKVVIGGASGVLSLWERGVWDDLDERIVLDKGPQGGESVDVLAAIPDERDIVMPGGGKGIIAGMGNGMIVLTEIGGQNGIVDVFRHDEAEGVVGLGFDVAGRMITGGGSIVKVWREKDEEDEDEEDEEEEEEKQVNGLNGTKRTMDSDSDEDGNSNDEESGRRRKKKKKKGQGFVGANGTSFSFKGLD